MKTENYVRDRFAEFELFRSKCAMSQKVNSLQQKCIEETTSTPENIKQHTNQSKQKIASQREWERAFSAFRVVANAVDAKINELEKLQSQTFKLRFTTTKNRKVHSEEEECEEEEREENQQEEEYENASSKSNSAQESKAKQTTEQTKSNDAHTRIGIMREEIIKLIKQLDHLVKFGVGVPNQCTTNADGINFRSESLKLQTSEEFVIATNVQRSLTIRLDELARKFKKIENAYYSRCRRRQERENAFKKVGSDEVYNLIDHESKAAEFLYLGYGEEEVNTLVQERSRQEELSKEVSELVKSIDEVNSIFNDIHTFVSNQGTILDRIDYNLHISAKHTKLAQNELTKAAEYQSKCCVM